ncbi:MAG: type II toxin-antitoxin system RelE/ParE family toxin [Clostridiales bacterium]|jgi:phage-related protein|nr:type II toxin-antitoxin system RelE/ParE family toxin [Clostridiales bacterium]
MFEVITYKDKSGVDKIMEYVKELDEKAPTSKDARIKRNKILEYIELLRAYGVNIGKPAVEHITNTELWELRPLRDRILFTYWKDNIFVLLHIFQKKTQKTPPQEIAQAQRNLKDFLERSEEK